MTTTRLACRTSREDELENVRVETATLHRLVQVHGAQLLRTARRYAATSEDAEDAYQRALEILLRKGPRLPERELVPWLKTVIKHEAFALRRHHARTSPVAPSGAGGESDQDFTSFEASPSEQVERLDRLRLGAEALHQLKPQEARAMRLLAEGYSYRQICEETGWTYTKVNRCLAEGRESFSRRIARLESGAECERLRPRLRQVLAGPDASEEEVLAIRRHLKTCLSCRAKLRAAYGTLVAPVLPCCATLSSTAAGLSRRMLGAVEDAMSVAKLKLLSLTRLLSVDPGRLPNDGGLLVGGRGIVSTSLAKGLALLCIGSAGAGGAAAGIESAAGARESGTSLAISTRSEGNAKTPGGPDSRLVAERLSPAVEARPSGRPRAFQALPQDASKPKPGSLAKPHILRARGTIGSRPWAVARRPAAVPAPPSGSPNAGRKAATEHTSTHPGEPEQNPETPTPAGEWEAGYGRGYPGGYGTGYPGGYGTGYPGGTTVRG